MPPNPQRRTLILDAAIDILNDVGVGGVTHRQVDERAGLPPGTTSNYFRTRLALLEATAGRVVELHWRNVAALQRLGGSTGDRQALVTLMGALISSPDPAVRRLLILHGTSCRWKPPAVPSSGRSWTKWPPPQ